MALNLSRSSRNCSNRKVFSLVSVYVPRGEEIDGSFLLGARTFLLEAKWHSDDLPASQVYAFKGKVDGKLVGTIGVFISISGYSSDAVDALSLGKALNVILFDGNDFEAALFDGFQKVLLAKLRYAAEEGAVYFPYQSTQIYGGPDPDERFLTPEHELPTERVAVGSPEDIVIICEGQSDKSVLSELGARILRAKQLPRRIVVIPAMGKRGIPLLGNGLRELSPRSKFILVADSDGDPEGTERQLRESLEQDVHRIVVADPGHRGLAVPCGTRSTGLRAYSKQTGVALASRRDANRCKGHQPRGTASAGPTVRTLC